MRNSEDDCLQATSLDVLTVTHIETTQEHSVFVVYSIFEESEEEDRCTVHARSLVLSPFGKIRRECILPEKRIFI